MEMESSGGHRLNTQDPITVFLGSQENVINDEVLAESTGDGQVLYRVDEVCTMSGVKPYVLRFWESEFPEITPIQSAHGQKLYTPKDIETVALIKKFLFEEKMSIEKARLKILAFSRGRDLLEAEKMAEVRPVSEQISAAPAVAEDSSVTPQPTLDLDGLHEARVKLREMLLSAESLQKRFHWS